MSEQKKTEKIISDWRWSGGGSRGGGGGGEMGGEVEEDEKGVLNGKGRQ